MLGNLVEASCNFALIRGDEHDVLLRCVKASQHRFELLTLVGSGMVTAELRNNCMEEPRSRGQDGSLLYQKLWSWSNAGDDVKERLIIEVSRVALIEAFRARMHMK